MFKRFNKDMYSVSKTTANSAEPSECQSSNMTEDVEDLNHVLNDEVEKLFE